MGLGIAIAGLAVSAAASGYGAYAASKKTDIPGWKPMDIGGEVGKSLAANEANFERNAALTGKANTYNSAEILKMLQMAIPGFSGSMAQIGKLMESGLKGEVPDDVFKQLRAKNAAWGQQSGVGGAQALSYREDEKFGQTSYGITRDTINSFQSWTRNMASLFQPGMVNIASSFIEPKEWVKQVDEDRKNAWRVQMGMAIEDAQPSQTSAAIGAGAGALGSATSFYGGMKMAQNMGGGYPANLTVADMTPATRY